MSPPLRQGDQPCIRPLKVVERFGRPVGVERHGPHRDDRYPCRQESDMSKYVVLPVTGDIIIKEVEAIELDDLKQALACEDVEPLALSRYGNMALMWRDSAGDGFGLRVNRRADYLGHLFGEPIDHGTIVGDVALTGVHTPTGEKVGLDEEWLSFLTDARTFEDVEQPA